MGDQAKRERIQQIVDSWKRGSPVYLKCCLRHPRPFQSLAPALDAPISTISKFRQQPSYPSYYSEFDDIDLYRESPDILETASQTLNDSLAAIQAFLEQDIQY